MPVTLQTYLVYRQLGKHVPLGPATPYLKRREVEVEEYFLHLCSWHMGYLYHLCLTIGVSGEINHPATRCTASDVILLVARYGINAEAIDEIASSLSVTIYIIVDGALVAALPYLHMHYVLAHVNLVGNTYHLKASVAIEYYNIVNIRAVTYKLSLLQSCTDKAFLTVYVQFLIGLNNLRGLYGVKLQYLSESWMFCSVFRLQVLKPLTGNIHHSTQVALYLGNLTLYACYQLVGLIFREFQDALHLYLHEAQNVFLPNLTHHPRIVWCESFINMLAGCIHACGILVFLVLINALLYEYLFQ